MGLKVGLPRRAFPSGLAAATAAGPLLDNYESLTLGPRLPGGRSLLLQSDDNFSAGQDMRMVALGAENGQLS